MTTGIVFDIQKFAIHDGPGIRTLVFMKGCPLRCLWCDNPESQNMSPEIAFFESNCIRCGNCLPVCPVKAITEDNGVFKIDKRICDNCGKCAERCYANAKKLIGKRMNVDEVLNEVKKDILFYRNSGGGITVSGGEPLMQPIFVLELLKRCQQLGINTAIETSGYAEYKTLRKVSQYLDLLYFDIKHMDPVKHKKLTGVSNKRILQNAKRIAKESKRMIIRVPVIPGYNDSEENIKSVAEFVTYLVRLERIELLPYHRLGEPKYQRLGRKYELEGLQPPDKEHMRSLKDMIEPYGIEIQIGG